MEEEGGNTDGLLAEIGSSLQHSHKKLMNWTTSFVLTGAFLNSSVLGVSTDARLWRFSPDEKFFPTGLSAAQSVQSSILSSSPAVLAAGPWSVRLPASRVLESDPFGLKGIAPQGIFVTQPTSKLPVYTFCASAEWDECGQCVSDNHPSAKCSAHDQEEVCFCEEFEPLSTVNPTMNPIASKVINPASELDAASGYVVATMSSILLAVILLQQS